MKILERNGYKYSRGKFEDYKLEQYSEWELIQIGEMIER